MSENVRTWVASEARHFQICNPVKWRFTFLYTHYSKTIVTVKNKTQVLDFKR